MTSDEHARRAGAFGVQAGAYARGRPGYPAEALRWCLPAQARRVLDLGAGTGKLTEGLLSLGLDVVAVEPAAEMRALIPVGAEALEGAAEAIPLGDGSVDAVLVGQAFHWFERDAALGEIVRVLRPGGVVGLLWNRIRTDDGWVAELAQLMHEASHLTEVDAPWSGRGDLTEPEWRVFAHVQDTDEERLADNVASRSLVILQTPEERERVLTRVREIAPKGRFEIPLECGVWRATRL